jgi:AraC family transcriptional regulator of adaptative response / DNA-3-methyladenine glycosylase II
MIEEGALDGDDASLPLLAERLGIGDRQLRRLFDKHLGVSPIALAQIRRVLLAKQLLHQTSMSIAEVALASGFSSVRRFNAAFLKQVGLAPTSLRRASRSPQHGTSVTILLSYSGAYDWPAMHEFFAARALDGCENTDAGCYRRSFLLQGEQGTLEVAPHTSALSLKLQCSLTKLLPQMIARVRRMFDVDADTAGIARHLSKDALLSPLVRSAPGLRVPGAWDGFEQAVRAILGQQISVAAARRLASILVAEFGQPLAPSLQGGGLAQIFPEPHELMQRSLAILPMPKARSAALSELAKAAMLDPCLFEWQRYSSLEDAVSRFKSIKGLGDWTAQYIALRGLHDPDAFPRGDAALQRSFAQRTRQGSSAPGDLTKQAESWRPWRAYAAQHLWHADVRENG